MKKVKMTYKDSIILLKMSIKCTYLTVHLSKIIKLFKSTISFFIKII